MASYVENVLSRGEKVVYQGKVSVLSLAPMMLLGLFFVAQMGYLIVVGLGFWAVAAIRYFTTELAVTNKRLIAKFGLISRSTIEINVRRAESVQVDQGILGRAFNYGTIVVSGAGNPQAQIRGIAAPLKFRAALFDAQEAIGDSESDEVVGAC